MENKALTDILKKSGFSDKEIDIYLALLELGSSVASDIAKRAGIIRSTAYVVLDSLLKRGLVTVTERRGVKMYHGASPDELVRHLEESAKQYTVSAGEVKKLLPKLKADHSSGTPRPKVRLFEGEEGMKSVYEDALSSLEAIRSYAFEKVEATEQAMPQNYYDRLAKKKIKIRALFPETAKALELAKGGQYDFSPDISVYDDKIVFMSPEEKFGLIIESKELASALKKAFDLSWKDAKRSGKLSFGVAG